MRPVAVYAGKAFSRVRMPGGVAAGSVAGGAERVTIPLMTVANSVESAGFSIGSRVHFECTINVDDIASVMARETKVIDFSAKQGIIRAVRAEIGSAVFVCVAEHMLRAVVH